MAFTPGYLKLYQSSKLQERADEALRHLERCDLCAWDCRAERSAGMRGVCRTASLARLASYGAHMGEERVLTGRGGSGTIFFAGCNMRCQYCQNHDISQSDMGRLVEPAGLAEIMLDMQHAGCHNINLVSPSHVIPQILAALPIAAQTGLHLPLVYNTGGFDSMTGLQLLEGVIDIYMPDMKYASQQIGRVFSKTPRYPQVNQAAVKEMHRQVGDLQIGPDGLAERGLLVRHLVLPNNLAGTHEVLQFVREEISPNTYLNLMDQYHPEHNVKTWPHRFPKLARRITRQEYQAAVETARSLGLTRLDPG